MAQEFIIKSDKLEDKIRQLLPSQGGFQAGVDLSASTQIVPIIDLTESAEGSNQRQDLQTALSLNDITTFDISSTGTLVSTTGYFRVFGIVSGVPPTSTSANYTATFSLTDGVTTKNIAIIRIQGTSTTTNIVQLFDFIVFLPAGQSLTATTSNSVLAITGSTKQIATLDGTLTNPS